MDTNRRRRDILKAGAAGATVSLLGGSLATHAQEAGAPMLILRNGKFTTLDAVKPNAPAGAIVDGRVSAVGDATGA